MDKQQAIDFIFEKLDQGESSESIVTTLSREIKAPVEMVTRFVAQVEAQYWTVRPPPPLPEAELAEEQPVEESPPPKVVLPPWLQDQALSADQPAGSEVAPQDSAPAIPSAAALDWSTEPSGPVSPPVAQPAPQKASAAGGPARKQWQEALRDPVLINFVKRELGKGRKRSDVVMTICERSGAQWDEAQRFVNQVAIENRGRINVRRNLLVFPFSIGFIIAGLFLAVLSGATMVYIFSGLLSFEYPLSFQPTSQDLQNAPIAFFAGLGLIAGGVIGLINVIRSIAH